MIPVCSQGGPQQWCSDLNIRITLRAYESKFAGFNLQSFWFTGFGTKLRMCISNKFPVAAAVCGGHTLRTTGVEAQPQHLHLI